MEQHNFSLVTNFTKLNSTCNDSNCGRGRTLAMPSLFQESQGIRAFRLVIESIAFVLGILGNIMVCVVTSRRRNMKTVGNLLILNLAVADLGALLTCFSFVAIRMEFPYSWPFGEFVCKTLYPFADIFNGTMIGTITAIAYHRYRMLVHCMNPQMNHQKARRILFLIWSFSFVVIVFPRFFVMELKITPVRSDCLPVWPNVNSRKFYRLMLPIIFYFVPLGFILMSYFKIRTHLKTNIQKHQNSRRNSFRADSTRKAALARVAQNKRAITRLLTPILITFAVCLFPSVVFVYYVESLDKPEEEPYLRVFYNLTIVLFIMNTAADPIIYSYVNTDFRREFCRLTRCTMRECYKTETQQLDNDTLHKTSSSRLGFLVPKRSSLLLGKRSVLSRKTLDNSNKGSIYSKKPQEYWESAL